MHTHHITNTEVTIGYADVHGDLLPINNDDNFCKAVSSANPLLRVFIQKRGTQEAEPMLLLGAHLKNKYTFQFCLSFQNHVILISFYNLFFNWRKIALECCVVPAIQKHKLYIYIYIPLS